MSDSGLYRIPVKPVEFESDTAQRLLLLDAVQRIRESLERAERAKKYSRFLKKQAD